MKKFLKLFAVVALLFNVGGFASQKVDAQEEITVWAWDPQFNIRAFEIARDIYLEENPDFNLNIVESAQDDIVARLNTSLSSGVTVGLPNIVLIEDYRAASFLQSYPDAFYPLTDYFNAEDFAPYKVEATSLDGVNYGVPFDTGVTGLYIRVDLLEEAGYTLDDVTDITWNELIEVGQGIYDATGVKLLSMDLNDLGLLRAMINASGVWYTEEDGLTPNIANNDALKEAFVTFKTMNDAGLVNIHNDWAQMLQAFNTGVVATVPQGNWITPSITAAEDQAGLWAVVPWPRQDIEGSVNASNLGGSSVYVLNVEGAEQAAEFVGAIIGGNEEFYRSIMNEIGALGTYLPLLETDAYDIEVDYFGGQKIYADFAEWSGEIPATNYGSHTYAIEDIMKNALQQYLSGSDIDEVFNAAQQQAENQLQ
ncbi:ABC transporter substrate-binding protein [Fundicoccus culcitae]|uniref:ABC transporter substrate-binding protein n=1 Tax=Fundicoccus culcitae TaxID=2969821 RepID=A0ABY5P8G0_9LACT|nr:ABC transporter substrate-binding protein [Fundicoccus culcitae]UUX34760.1 ABC transporter substrate-binding protein [Fundicoccus culcitae]